MAQLLVRNLDDKVIVNLKMRAKANNRSTEAEAREILATALTAPKPGHRSLLSLAGAGKTGRTPEEIVAYVRGLRDEWER